MKASTSPSQKSYLSVSTEVEVTILAINAL
jgi:hypothetical protein